MDLQSTPKKPKEVVRARNTDKCSYDAETERVKELSATERVKEFSDAYWKVKITLSSNVF